MNKAATNSLYLTNLADSIRQFWFSPNRRIVEPLKLGLAMAIIYAIAFYMGWSKPYWATVSAVSVNLLSTGLTLHRGLIRVLGTAVGGFMGLALIGVFPQERWAYLCVASVVLFICGYLATGKKEPYFYLIVLITFIVVMAVVQSKDYTDSGNAFSVVMLRVTQTWLGSLVMILIMVYVFPYRTVDEFEDLARKRWANQRQLYSAYRGLPFGEEPAEDTKHLRLEDAPLLHFSHFKLHGAEQDTFEMLEIGHDWHVYLDLTAAQYETLESLRQSLAEARGLELTTYLPNLEDVCAELDRRFEQTERMLAKKAPTDIPHHIAVSLDEDVTRALPHFKEAAVRVIKAQIEKLEEVSLELYGCIAKIRQFERPAGAHDDHHGHGAKAKGFAVDPFQLRAAIAFVVSVWVAFLIWLYVYDIPRGSLFTCFVVITASISAYRPEMPQIVYGAAWLVGGLVAFPCYVLIMQHLSGNLQLSIMIMIAIFVMQYALWPHVHPIARIFTSIGFVIVIDAENHQSYSMVNYLQTMLWMATSIAVTLVVRFAFFPRRPDTTFLGLLNQFFRHADFLLSAYDAEGRPDRSLGRRWRSIFYRHSILGLADKMALYAGQADFRTGQLTYKMLRGATPEQMQELIRAVFALGHRIEALVEARKAWQSNAVDQHVMAEKREWLQAMHEWFRLRPGAAQVMGPDEDLQAWLAKLETRIDEAFERIEDGELSTEDYENFYQRLGSYRGLTEAVNDYVRVAATFDWPRWQEMRF
jgi:uncharacterized membrane protein YccC